MKLIAGLSFFVAFLIIVLPVETANQADSVIGNIVTNLRQDMATMVQYGSHQRVVTTKLNDDGSPKRIEEKRLRTVWVGSKPSHETISFQCKEMDDKGKSRQCEDLQKTSYQKDSKQKGKIESEIKKVRWTELHKGFEFSALRKDGPNTVVSFKPKGEMNTRNRIEKLLSRMTGNIWIDPQFNVVKAEARLVDTVTFGLGIVARVHQLDLQYEQRPYQDVWMPSSLTVDFKAKIALLHTERQRIEAFWTAPYNKSDAIWAKAASDTSTVHK
jgi:hypothetical protein